MNVHKNARPAPRGRERIVELDASGRTPKAIAEAVGLCPRTVRKWIACHRTEGTAGLLDRSSRPHRLHRPTPEAVVEQVERLRRQRGTGKQIAAEAGVSPATVSRVLRRLGLHRLSALELEPVRRAPRRTFDRRRRGGYGSDRCRHRKCLLRCDRRTLAPNADDARACEARACCGRALRIAADARQKG